MLRLLVVLLVFWSNQALSLDIVPSESVLGVPWDSTEQEVAKILGESNGYFQTTKYNKLVFYGKSVVLIFTRGKLKGFRYHDVCCTDLYNTSVSINSKYSREAVVFNGIDLKGKTFQEINELLPFELGKPDYRAEIATDEVTIEFGFSSRGYPGQQDQFNFNSLKIDYEL
ncbi:hypothetical protein KQ940_10730 [Marinobacterium sp. D7]|uniref:hypothetical protein n=1 Tax=Marinobacterium ramblicola TaxID=2849041 RepID=UPI001C2D8F75|nr:hypothetical protein [Marinobacterium ramblicola]MBV1788529.1 hypothetical protein [Marinobacterium ramblicola]